MIVLDTNVVSESAKPSPNRAVVVWFRRQRMPDLFLTGPTIMEQSYGAELFFLRSGSDRYERTLKDIVLKDFRDRILAFDGGAPILAGKLRARRESMGRPISVGDAMIAAICLVNDVTLATRNVRDFEGLDLKLVNPFETDG
jgi:predicted nucleic acid-binding protein